MSLGCLQMYLSSEVAWSADGERNNNNPSACGTALGGHVLGGFN